MILDAALDVFADHGFRGATLNQISEVAGLSKPNVLYYFSGKEAIYTELLLGLLDVWLDPLKAIDPMGEPVDEIVAYMLRKLDMSQRIPRESRLFANEIVQGAPHIQAAITGPLRDLVNEKAEVIRAWSETGRLAPTDPHHLIFSIWSTTQHYADFDVQIRGILGSDPGAHFPAAAAFLEQFYRRALLPR